IAKFLTQQLNTKEEKARAIYIWISQNIRYDLGNLNSTFRYRSVEEVIDDVMETRKGVCLHYAALFQAMCKTVGLESFQINGYTRDGSGKIAELSHSWNALQLDS